MMPARLDTPFGTLDPVVLALVAAVGLATLCLALFVGMLVAGAQRRTSRRIRTVTGRWQPHAAGGEGARSLRLAQYDSSIPSLDKIIGRILPQRDMLRRRLVRTGTAITIPQYLLASVGVAVIAFVIAAGVFGQPLAIAALGAVSSAVGLPHAAVGFLAGRRQRKFTDQFPEGIDLIVRGLRSGLPVIESIITVGREMANPVGPEFRAIADAVRFGKTIEEALWDAVPRIDTPEFKFFVVALSVQRETGGNLAETLENLADVLRKRRQMKKRIKAMASEPKASAWILGSLPFIMFAIIMAVNAGYIMTLFTDPRGTTLIGIGLLSQFIGIAVMFKMVRFEI